MFAIHGYPSEALEAHVYIKTLQASIPQAGDGIFFAYIAFGIMLSYIKYSKIKQISMYTHSRSVQQ